MEKIQTDSSLYDVLRFYSHQKDNGMSTLRFDSQLVTVKSLAYVAVSDINKGQFKGYSQGELTLAGNTPISDIACMADQEVWLRSGFDEASRLLVRDDGSAGYLSFAVRDVSCGNSSWARFYATDDPELGVSLEISRRDGLFTDTNVNGIVAPFVDPILLDDIVEEVMAGRNLVLRGSP